MIEINLPKKVRKSLEKEARESNRTLEAHIVRKLEGITPSVEYVNKEKIEKNLQVLTEFLSSIPDVKVISSEVTQDVYWWIKLDIDIHSDISWNIIQELGYVLNYISIQEPLPTVFKPVSPPPYMNGGPTDFLSWAIESTFNYIDPKWIKEVIEGRLPNPVTDKNEWKIEE